MSVQDQIEAYLASHPEPKRGELRQLHQAILGALPGCTLWFSDGKNEDGKVVANPSIGYGSYVIRYANGTTREFFQIGLSANQSGISVHIMGIADKSALSANFGSSIGKASVTGYCVKFRKLSDIDLGVLVDAVRFGVAASNNLD